MCSCAHALDPLPAPDSRQEAYCHPPHHHRAQDETPATQGSLWSSSPLQSVQPFRFLYLWPLRRNQKEEAGSGLQKQLGAGSASAPCFSPRAAPPPLLPPPYPPLPTALPGRESPCLLCPLALPPGMGQALSLVTMALDMAKSLGTLPCHPVRQLQVRATSTVSPSSSYPPLEATTGQSSRVVQRVVQIHRCIPPPPLEPLLSSLFLGTRTALVLEAVGKAV